jgi:hypothetical protein
MFTTRKQAIDWLVTQGKPLAHAKVAIDQAFNYDDDGATDNLCRRTSNDWQFTFAPGGTANLSDCVPVTLTEADVLSAYNDFCGPNGYFKLTEQGFCFDGDEQPTYDINGDHV